MLRAKDRHQQHLFDPWGFLSPKRREKLDQEWPGFFRDHILDVLPVERLALAFPETLGRPTKDLYTVTGVLALQQYHNLSDIETCEQLSYNIQWHYALDIAEESDDAKYICPKTLWNMRALAVELGLESVFFDSTARRLAEAFEVDTSRQRLDSVQVRSNMARLGRMAIFVRGIDRFLVNLKRHHRPLWEQVDSDLIERYQGEKARQCFGGVKPSESNKKLKEVASDLYRLVQQFESHSEVSNMDTYKTLCRIVKEQCNVDSDGTIEVKVPKEIPSDSLQNPSDPDATYSGHKGQGYQVQVMETYCEHEGEKDPTELNLITHVEVEPACQSDAQALLPAIEASMEKDLAPEQVQADALYSSDENIQEAEDLGVEVIGPVMGTEKDKGCRLSDFQFASTGHIEQCPAGHRPTVCRKKKGRYSQGFAIEHCESCPLAESCMAKRGKEFFYVRYTEKAMRIAKRRQHEQSAEFREKYRWRAGVEATMSQFDRLTGVKRLRVRGAKPVRFAVKMKAAALNIARAVAVERARRRAESPDPSRSGAGQGIFRFFKEHFCRIFRPLLGSAPAQARFLGLCA